RRAIVALHQLLARALFGRIAKPELGRERALQVEYQAILAAAREEVQSSAKVGDRPFLLRNGARFGARHQAVSRELAPRTAELRRARNPDDRLQIAQAAGTLLDVGLEVVCRVVMLEMPLLLLERLG